MTEAKTLIIIPAHNEERSIAPLIKAIESFVPESDILVINDASTDRTSEAARSVNTELSVTVIDVPVNLGIGGAMQTGFKYAKENGYNTAVQIDGDGQHPPKFIKELLTGILSGKADMTIGSRFIMEKGFKGAFLRRMGIKYFAFLIRFFTGFSIQDATSGFRAFSRKAIHIFSEYYPHDYPEVESFIVLHKVGLRVIEKAVTMKRRKHGSSTINWADSIYYMVRVTLGIIISTLRSYGGLKEV